MIFGGTHNYFTEKQYGYSEDEGYAFDSIEQQEGFTKASTLISD